MNNLTDFKELLTKNEDLNNRYNTILIDKKYIREEEREVITFSRIGVLNLIESLEMSKDWKIIYNKDSLTIHIQDKSIITDKVHIGKHTFKIPKTSFKNEVTLPFLRRIVITLFN